MKKFMSEQETAAKPPEPRGEQTPGEEHQRILEEESGETLLDETMPEEEQGRQVEWDGSEAELVADEDAAEYEEQKTGIKLKYALKSGEIFTALWKTQLTQTRISIVAFAVVVCLFSAVVFSVQYTFARDSKYIMLAGLCLVLIFVLLWTPYARIRAQAKEKADGHEVRMKIYPDQIEMGREETRWEIPLDGSVRRMVFKDLILLYIDDGNLVILPIRCIEPAVLPEVQAMLFAGTRPDR